MGRWIRRLLCWLGRHNWHFLPMEPNETSVRFLIRRCSVCGSLACEERGVYRYAVTHYRED